MTPDHLIVAGATMGLVLLAMLLHYEASFFLRLLLKRYKSLSLRTRIITLTSGLFCAHVAQIWLFGVGALLLVGVGDTTGTIGGMVDADLLDFIYLSATSFTTVGFGDIYPVGHLRFLFGTEALVGFMLLTWSASLTFVEIQTHWRNLDGG
jgi:hypothetical protein